MSRSHESRRFSEDEVREVIARASESSAEKGIAHPRGLSLAELKEIGREVGIDPARLEDAAREVARRPNRPSGLMGAPRILAVQRRLPGDFDPTDAPEVLAAIREGMEAQAGDVSEVHGSLEWSEAGEFYQRHVAISSNEGITTIRGTSNLTNATVMVFGGAIATTVMGTILPAIVLEEMFNTGGLPFLIIPLFLLPAALMLARVVMGNIVHGESDRLEEVADRLEAFAKPYETEPEEG